jgi:hypothetical protein
MGTIKIQFQGVTVHFRQPFHPFLPFAHRVVMLNVTRGATLGGAAIPPHFGVMTGTGTLVPPQVGINNPMPLTGVSLRVLDPATIGCTYDPSYERLPNLTTLTASKGETLGPPSLPVLVGADPDLVAGYFDFDSGSFTACTDNGAAGVTVDVTTTTDPVQLQVTPFAMYPSPAPEPWSLSFSSGSSIIVQLVAPDEGPSTDGLEHFFLSYLTADTLPSVLSPPGDTPPDCGLFRGIAGPGCSDSNYP